MCYAQHRAWHLGSAPSHCTPGRRLSGSGIWGALNQQVPLGLHLTRPMGRLTLASPEHRRTQAHGHCSHMLPAAQPAGHL